VSFGMMVSGKNHLVEGNDIEQLVWGEGVGDCDYVRFFGEGHIFRRNYLHGTKKEEVGPAHVDGWQTYAVNPGEYAKDILIDGNILTGYFWTGVMCEGAKAGARVPSAEGIRVWNNVFSGGANVARVVNAHRVEFCHNTFIQNRAPALGGLECMAGSNGPGVTARVVNNIFYDSRWYTRWQVPSGSQCEVEGEGNILFIPGRRVPQNPLFSRDIRDTDPLLVDPGNIPGPDGKPFTEDDGYLLKSGSPCIDAGARIEGQEVKDILGTSRPQGASWDIGAYEARPAVPPR